jgi:glycerol-3-phosphate acyltransferase PlsX
VGATTDATPEMLAQFALAGAAFASVRLGIAAPRVGLLSVGEEPGKGDDLRKAAYDALVALPLDFVGNVEGRDVPHGGRADVVVTDGFTGNVLAKGLEGAATMLSEALLAAMTSTPERTQAAKALLPALAEATAHMSPEKLGGAVLLGVDGVVVVGHGASSPEGVASCVGTAAQAVREGLVPRIASALSDLLDRSRVEVAR